MTVLKVQAMGKMVMTLTNKALPTAVNSVKRPWGKHQFEPLAK